MDSLHEKKNERFIGIHELGIQIIGIRELVIRELVSQKLYPWNKDDERFCQFYLRLFTSVLIVFDSWQVSSALPPVKRKQFKFSSLIAATYIL